MDYYVAKRPSGGPAWSQEILDGARACRAGADEVRLNISPAVSDWGLTVSCDRLPP